MDGYCGIYIGVKIRREFVAAHDNADDVFVVTGDIFFDDAMKNFFWCV